MEVIVLNDVKTNRDKLLNFLYRMNITFDLKGNTLRLYRRVYTDNFLLDISHQGYLEEINRICGIIE